MNLHKYKIKRKYLDDIEPEEIFLDSQKIKKSAEGEKEKLEKPIKEGVFKIFLILITIVLGVVFLRSLQLQIIEGKHWQELADKNRIRSYPIPALRGIIYDKNGIPLAINSPKIDVVFTPSELTKRQNYEETIKRLSSEFQISEEELKNKAEKHKMIAYPIILKENIDPEKAIILQSEIKDLPEINIVKNTFRQYKNGAVFSHVLGYIGKISEEELRDGNFFIDDFIGKTGIEKVYDEKLRGVKGKQLIEVDSIGKIQKVLAEIEPKNGEDLVLSIDSELQEKIYNTLLAKINALSVSKAAAVAVNPQNGKILALVSLPSFDNNLFIGGISPEESYKVFNNPNQPLFNRAISGLYSPGSTIKPLIALAALEEKIIDPNRKINCQGALNLLDKFNKNVIWTYGDWKAHGPTDMVKAIAESCDVYFYTVGGGYGDISGLGPERIKKYLENFGFGKVSGIDLIGEKPGLLPDPKWMKETRNIDWSIGHTYNISIGQGDILASPLQIAMATAMIANGGKLLKPQIIQSQEPEIIRENFINPEFIKIVKTGMREAVISGSSRLLADLPVAAAGKTGTAEAGKNKNPHSWFTVFAPYENSEIVITILIENGGEGSSTAVPVAREILNWYFGGIAKSNNL